MNKKIDIPYVFSDAGQAALRDFIDRSTLFAFDLDGTLVPIVSNPSQIIISEETSARLNYLNHIVPVAIITGRSCADARKHLRFNPSFLVGNHGAEGLPGKHQCEIKFHDICKGWMRQIEILMPQAEERGIVIENKGITLCFHYRKALDKDGARKEIIELIRQLEPPPRRIPGKYTENIIPVNAPNKGEALLQIMWKTGCKKAIYLGDDATDEDVFNLLKNEILGIKVGYEALSLADYFLSDQIEINRLLDECIRLIK